MMRRPSQREIDLAQREADGFDRDSFLAALIEYTDALVLPFDELAKDLEALGDHKLARAVRELVDTAKGTS